MSLLKQIQSGPKPAPRRVLLYGVHGVGKSTFAAQAPKPIFIQTEDGVGAIDCDRFPLANSFDDVMKALVELYGEDHPYQSTVIDSSDWLQHLIFRHVCQERSVEMAR